MVPPPPTRPPALRGRLFRGSAAVRDGHLTPAQLRTRAWVRLFPDVYACASLPRTHSLRARAAARLLVPGAIIAGRSAATWWGVAAAEAEDDVELFLSAAAAPAPPAACEWGARRSVQRRPAGCEVSR